MSSYLSVGSVTVSVVSHGHGSMVTKLISQLLEYEQINKIILTLNIPESLDLDVDDRVVIVKNAELKGFGGNHNIAFQLCRTPFFCVLNPDIIFNDNIFPHLLESIGGKNVGVVAPLVRAPAGGIEDSIRRFPTLTMILKKVMGYDEGPYVISEYVETFNPDWVAGMFMLYPAKSFDFVGGFDEKFFLYYEDVDICAQLWLAGLEVKVCTSVSVIHDAQRASHRNLSHLKWHVSSFLRYLFRYAFRKIR